MHTPTYVRLVTFAAMALMIAATSLVLPASSPTFASPISSPGDGGNRTINGWVFSTVDTPTDAYERLETGETAFGGVVLKMYWVDNDGTVSPTYTTTSQTDGSYSFAVPTWTDRWGTTHTFDAGPHEAVKVWIDRADWPSGYDLTHAEMGGGMTTSVLRNYSSWNLATNKVINYLFVFRPESATLHSVDTATESPAPSGSFPRIIRGIVAADWVPSVGSGALTPVKGASDPPVPGIRVYATLRDTWHNTTKTVYTDTDTDGTFEIVYPEPWNPAGAAGRFTVHMRLGLPDGAHYWTMFDNASYYTPVVVGKGSTLGINSLNNIRFMLMNTNTGISISPYDDVDNPAPPGGIATASATTPQIGSTGFKIVWSYTDSGGNSGNGPTCDNLTADSNGSLPTCSVTTPTNLTQSRLYSATLYDGTGNPVVVDKFLAKLASVSVTGGTVAPDGTIGSGYTGPTPTVAGGTGSHTFAVTNGSLPAGLTLNSSTGQITGTPTTAGTSTFTVTVTDTEGNTATYSDTIVISAPPTFNDLSATLTNLTDVTPGTTRTARLRIRNTGPDNAASDTSVTYTPPAGITLTDTPTGCTLANNALSCSLPSARLSAGAVIDMDVSLRVPSNATQGTVFTAGSPGTLSVTNAEDNDTSNNTATHTVTAGTPRATLTVSTSSTTLTPGAPGTASFSIGNDGPSDATNTTAALSLPTGITVDTTALPSGCVAAQPTGPITCTIGTITSTASPTTLAIPITAASSLAPGTTLTARLTPASDTSPSVAASTLNMGIGDRQTDLILTASSTHAVPGTTVTQQFTLANHGPSDAGSPALISYTAPASTRITGAGPGCVIATSATTTTCTVDALATGTRTTRSVTLAVDPDVTEGTILNGHVTSTTIDDPATANNTATPQLTISAPQAPLSVTVNPVTTTTPGTATTVTVTVTNTGPSTAVTPRVTMTLPAEVNLSASNLPTGCTTPGTAGPVTCTASSLAPHESMARQIVVTTAPSASPNSTLSASVTASSAVSAAVLRPVPIPLGDARADLAAATATPPMLGRGQHGTMTVRITNNGPSTATDASMTYQLPNDVRFAPPSGYAGSCTATAGVVTCPAGTAIDAGNTVAINIPVAMPTAPSYTGPTSGGDGLIVASSADPLPSNNSFTFLPTWRNTPGVELSGHVFLDQNRSGTHNTGERDISGVEVTLTTPGPDNVWGTSDDVVVDRATTASPFRFYDVLPGNYRVHFDTATFPRGLHSTTNTVGLVRNISVADRDLKNQNLGLYYLLVRGQVAVDGEPVPSASVVVTDANGGIHTTRTDDLGRYQVSSAEHDSLAPGPVSVVATANTGAVIGSTPGVASFSPDPADIGQVTHVPGVTTSTPSPASGTLPTTSGTITPINTSTSVVRPTSATPPTQTGPARSANTTHSATTPIRPPHQQTPRDATGERDLPVSGANHRMTAALASLLAGFGVLLARAARRAPTTVSVASGRQHERLEL